MGIELVPNRNEFMSYYIVNHTDQYLECSYWRKLEICNDSEWYEFGGNPWILSSEMIGPDGTQQMEDAWLHFYRVHGQEQAFALLNFIIGKEQKMKKIGGGLDDCLSKVNSLRHHFDSNIVLFANKNDTLKIIWTV